LKLFFSQAATSFLILIVLLTTNCYGDDMNITVTFNNVPYDKDLETGWGFSAYIEGFEKNILFDTGDNGEILLSNMKKLGIDVKKIDIIVLSHIHADHTGGLMSVLEKNPDCTIYMPAAFPDDFKDQVSQNCKKAVFVDKATKICENVWSGGQLGTDIKEQALIIESKNGLVVITGCAHPGIVNVVRDAVKILNKDVFLIIGGFHFKATPNFAVQLNINNLKKIGVKKVAPSHCTGEKATELFKKAWGDGFVDLGCGASIRIEK